MTTTTLSDPSTLPLEPVASGSTPEALSVPNEIFLSLLHHPSFFEQASNTMLSLPPVLSFSYAAALPIGTFLVRISSTLPLMLWQRKRTRRFAEKVMPLIRRAQSVAALEVRAECRKEGKSYEEYQAAYKKRAIKDAAVLSKANDATPMYTLYVPPLLNIPIFIATTLIIRDACTRSLSALSLFPPDEASTLINVDPTLVSYTSTTLGYLHDLAATPFLWCPSLVLPDPTLGLPLAVGLVSLLNVEYSAKTRRVNAVAAVMDNNARAQDEVKNRVKVPSNVVTGGGRAMTTAEKRRAMGVKVNKVDEVVDVPPESPFNRNLTNAMRGGSVAFIWLASMAPVAVCGYWLTSNLFTLGMNVTLARVDRQRDEADRARRLLAKGL